MKVITVLIDLERRINRAAEALHADLLSVLAEAKGNTPAEKLRQEQPDLWRVVDATEQAVRELEGSAYAPWRHRREPSVN